LLTSKSSNFIDLYGFLVLVEQVNESNVVNEPDVVNSPTSNGNSRKRLRVDEEEQEAATTTTTTTSTTSNKPPKDEEVLPPAAKRVKTNESDDRMHVEKLAAAQVPPAPVQAPVVALVEAQAPKVSANAATNEQVKGVLEVLPNCDKDKVMRAVIQANYNVEQAINLILSEQVNDVAVASVVPAPKPPSPPPSAASSVAPVAASTAPTLSAQLPPPPISRSNSLTHEDQILRTFEPCLNNSDEELTPIGHRV